MGKPKEEEVADATVTDGEDQPTETEEIETEEQGRTEEGTQETESEAEKEHKERSALGRRISAIERKTNERLEQIGEMVEKLLVSQSSPNDDEADEDDYVTRKALREELRRLRNEEQQNQLKYNREYTKTIEELGMDEDEETHRGIIKELEANFNFVYSEDGTKDAIRNYNKAAKAYFKKQLSLQKKKVPVRGATETPPLGSGADGDKIKAPNNKGASKLPPLDDAAKDFIKRRGLTEEQVQKYLESDMPLSLTGIKNEALK